MQSATRTPLLGAALILLFGAPRSEATIVFDFSGVCTSGDCEPDSQLSAVLRFDDAARLRHRDRAVSAADFESLVIEYFPTVSRARAEAHFGPATAVTSRT